MSRKITFLEDNGFTLAGYFHLEQDSCTKVYYEPMEERISEFLECHTHLDMTGGVVKEYGEDIGQYQKF